MKDLLDVLHNLDDNEYEVSPDFSSKIINEIKKGKIAKATKIISIVSCACVLCIGVFLVNKFDIFNASSSVSQSMKSMDSLSIQSGGMEAPTFNIQSNNATEYDSFVTEEAFRAPVSEPAAANDVVEEIVEKTDIQETSSMVDSQEDLNKTYSKQYNIDEYEKEIKDLLVENGFDCYINSPTQIVINSTDLNGVYSVIEPYINVELELRSEHIYLNIK